jgi:hypothetical protein
MDTKQETFSHYPIPAVKHISQDRNGQLWLSTSSGLYRLNPVTHDIRVYVHNPSDPESLHINEIRSAAEDRSGRIWIADADGMHEFDPRTGHLGLHIPILETARDFSFYEDRFGMFWLFCGSGNGLASFDRGSNVLTNYELELNNPANTALTGITGMLEDREGNLWIASQGLGLMRFDREHNRFLCYRHARDRDGSLLEDRVDTLLQDQEIDCVGAQETIRTGFGLLATAGTFVSVGLVGNRIDMPLFPFVAHEYSYHGSFWGNYSDLSEVIALAQAGRIKHAIKRIRLEDINENLELMRDGDIVGRAVVVYGEGDTQSDRQQVAMAAVQ